MAGSCSPPKGQRVKGYDRARPRKKPKPRPAAFVVVYESSGKVVTRHRTFGAAVRMERRLNRASRRKGQGAPFDARKA